MMAAIHFFLCLILCAGAPEVHSQRLRRFHVSEEGRALTALCPPHDNSYRSIKWSLDANILRPGKVLYNQRKGGTADVIGSRADISLNLTDFSLTIGSLQMSDTGRLSCKVEYLSGIQAVSTNTYLVVYKSWVGVWYNTNVTVHCPVPASEFMSRQWYTWPYSLHLIYNQTTGGVTEGRRLRDDMSLDMATFHLTIGRVGLHDYIFSCVTIKQQTSLLGIIFTAIYRTKLEVEENTSVTLPCDEVVDRGSRSYYNTRTWQQVNGKVLYHQYLYNGTFFEHHSAARPDVGLNNTTFALTIGRVQLEDDTMFVCTFSDEHRESVKLAVYINPRIVFSGLDEAPVSIDTTVTVTCTIDRVHPALGSDDFQMRWGTQTIKSIGSQNNDQSYRYTVQYMHTMTNGDNGTVLECFVNPNIGQSDFISRIVLLNSQRTSGLSLPVIGGAAAAAAVVIIIVIVVIVSVCVKRNTSLNKVTDQTSRAGESHYRHGPGAPDVTSHNKTYLPGADYHEYEEIATTDEPSKEGQYERLRVKANTPIEKWYKDKDIPKATVKKLKRQDVATLQHLQDMSRTDMVEAGLNVGERNRIRKALKETSTSWI